MNDAVVQRRRRPDRQHVPSHARGPGVVRRHEELNAIDEIGAPERRVQMRTALDDHRTALERREPAQRSREKRRRLPLEHVHGLDPRATPR